MVRTPRCSAAASSTPERARSFGAPLGLYNKKCNPILRVVANILVFLDEDEWKQKQEGRIRDPAHPSGNFAYERYDSTDPSLAPLAEPKSALFLAVVRPNQRLLFIGVLEQPKRNNEGWHAKPNRMSLGDMDALRSQLGLPAKGPVTKEQQAPRALNDEVVRILRALGMRKKIAITAAELIGKSNEIAKPKTAADPRAMKLTPVVRQLIEAAGQELVNEYLDELDDDAEAAVSEGDFGARVQSVFNGAFEKPSEAVPILSELAPFADGAVISSRIGPLLGKRDADVLALAGELADAFAVSALNVLGTAIAALATDQPDRVPPAAQPLVPHLKTQVAKVRRELDSL